MVNSKICVAGQRKACTEFILDVWVNASPTLALTMELVMKDIPAMNVTADGQLSRVPFVLMVRVCSVSLSRLKTKQQRIVSIILQALFC